MALRVVRALFDGVRDGLLVFFVGVVLFRAAAAGYFITFVPGASCSRGLAQAAQVVKIIFNLCRGPARKS